VMGRPSTPCHFVRLSLVPSPGVEFVRGVRETAGQTVVADQAPFIGSHLRSTYVVSSHLVDASCRFSRTRCLLCMSGQARASLKRG
jgi:hypothetical protein